MIREATAADIPDLAALWTRAFPGERTVEQRIRHLETGGVFGGLESIFAAEHTGRLTGAYRAYSLTQHMHGTSCRVMGLAAVAVDESLRRNGLGRELCQHALHIARQRGDVFSLLFPFRPSFYHALGWGMVGELHTHRFRPESIISRASQPVRVATAEDRSGIAACYSRVARASNGLIARSPRVWRQHLEGDGTFTYVTGADRVSGYLIVRHGHSAAPEERPLYIRELIADDHDSYDSLLAWVSAQRDTWRVVQYDASPDERFEHRLSDARPPGYHLVRNLWAPIGRLVRGPMMRVLDVKAALEQRTRWRSVAPLTFGLSIHDAQVPDGSGDFSVDFDSDRARVKRGTAPLTLRLGAPAFAQIFAGELSVMDALNLGVAECDGDAAAIDSLFRVDRCFRLLDEF